MLLIAACALTSCFDDLDYPEPVAPPTADDGYITIDVVAAKAPSRGKLDEPGVDGLNENRINSVILCLWPQAGDRPETVAPLYFNFFDNLAATGSTTLRVPLTEGLRRQLFESEGDDTRCLAYVAVNVNPGSATTVAELRNLVVNSSFATSKRQSYFTMDGDAAVTLSANGLSASATIGAHRSACKITLEVDCDAELSETGDDGTLVVWKSDLKAMTATLSNGVRRSTLTPRPLDGVNPADYFDTDPTITYGFVTAEPANEKYPLVQDIPFYTYPNAWTLSPEEENRTVVTLSVPWSPDGGQSWRTCYYQVPVVPVTSTSLARNTSYHIRLHVGMLGSFTPDIPLEVPDLSYTAADWGTENIDVAIDDYRYLVVEQNNFTVNNQETFQIPFYTSHRTEVVAAKLTFYRFNYSEEGTKFPVTVDWASTANTGVFNAKFYHNGEHATIKGDFLQVWHPLKMYQPYNDNTIIPLTNDGKKIQTADEIQKALAKATKYVQLKDDNEFSRVDIEVTVQHSDMKGQALWKETVYITQYPSIYIDARSNNYNRTSTNISGSGATGSCWINGNCESLDNSGSLGWTTSIGLSSSSYLNWNPNLYIVTVSQLPPNSEYQIGDPRTIGINNYLQDWTMNDAESYTNYRGPYNYTIPGTSYTMKFTTAKDMTGTSRTLKWYYPTQEGAATYNMLAPKFRICSSYAGTGDILNRNSARVRAASFQEMNYPAGRWRLPTFGEVKFIMDLSAQKKIPRLFGADAENWYYWCAQGAVYVAKRANAAKEAPYINSSINSRTSMQRARFVYDEWYWGDDLIAPEKQSSGADYPFRWGDSEKIKPTN